MCRSDTLARAGTRLARKSRGFARKSRGFARKSRGFACVLAAAGIGCRQDMHDTPRLEPLEGEAFFADGRGSRPLLAHTVPRGFLREDDHLYRGRVSGRLAEEPPFEIAPALLARGRERFDIFCAPCHDRVGTGRGMVVGRGFPRRPPSFHVARLVNAPAGHFFDVVTDGFGLMPSYAPQIPPEDRWAIVAWIRCLQLSQHARIDDVPTAQRRRLAGGGGR